MEYKTDVVMLLLKAGFKEVEQWSLRNKDYNEVIEYWDRKSWRYFAR